VLGLGTANDVGKLLTVTKSTKIVVKKDSQVIAEIPVKIK